MIGAYFLQLYLTHYLEFLQHVCILLHGLKRSLGVALTNQLVLHPQDCQCLSVSVLVHLVWIQLQTVTCGHCHMPIIIRASHMYNTGVKYVSAIEKSTFLLNFLAPAVNIDCMMSQHYNIGSSLVDTVTLNCK